LRRTLRRCFPRRTRNFGAFLLRNWFHHSNRFRLFLYPRFRDLFGDWLFRPLLGSFLDLNLRLFDGLNNGLGRGNQASDAQSTFLDVVVRDNLGLGFLEHNFLLHHHNLALFGRGFLLLLRRSGGHLTLH